MGPRFLGWHNFLIATKPYDFFFLQISWPGLNPQKMFTPYEISSEYCEKVLGSKSHKIKCGKTASKNLWQHFIPKTLLYKY